MMKIINKVNGEYPPKNHSFNFDGEVELLKRESGVSDFRLFKLEKGQTDTEKCIVEFGNAKFFIKKGEKVEKELEFYKKISQLDIDLFLQPLAHKDKSDTLILPFYDGHSLDEIIEDARISLNDLIICLRRVLMTTAEFLWLKHLKIDQVDTVTWVKNYIGSRNEFLSNSINIEIDDTLLSFDQFISYPIHYIANGESHELPPLREMIDKVLKLLGKFNSDKFTIITGDFQPANILVSGENLKIIDLSDGLINFDMALDLGKFFNYLDRFRYVAAVRDNKNGASKEFNVDISIVDNKIKIDSGKNVNYFSRLFGSLEQEISSYIYSNNHDYYLPDRIKIYKFVINYITLKRHIFYPDLVKMLLANIVDSYMEVINKVENL